MDQDYQEIDLIELIKKFVKFWWLLVLAAILCGGLAYYVTKTKITPIYDAQATIFIGKDASNFGEINLSALYAGDRLIVDYQELVKTYQVLESVVEKLKLDTSADVLRGKVQIQTVEESRFAYIKVSDPSPEMAMVIANTTAEVLKQKAGEIIGIKDISVVDKAKKPQYPSSPSTSRNVAIAGILGVMVALFIIFLNMMLSNRIEKDEDIEKIVGLPVIGIIPKFKGDPR